MPANTGFVPQVPAAPQNWSRIWAERVSTILKQLVSRENCTLALTLEPLAVLTVLTDFRIHPDCVLSFMPLTANAATAKPSIYVTAIGKGVATINHASAAAVDQSFEIAVLG